MTPKMERDPQEPLSVVDGQGGGSLRGNDILAGRYRLVRLLGEGGMGTVWEARQLATDKAVAVKVLKARGSDRGGESEGRFVREAKLAASLSHRNIVQVFDFWEADAGPAFLVMELLEGQSLAQLIEARHALPVGEALGLVRPIVEALAYAHAQGIVHRDLKPENILLTAADVKVLDFGLAKRQAEGADATVITQTGAVMGTPFYMSPEQVYGEKTVDARTDVWSMGVILYEVLSGRKPFVGENFGQIFRAITQEPLRPLREVAPGPIPPDLDRLVTRMVSQECATRPTMAEVSRSLDVLAAATAAPPTACAPRAPHMSHETALLPSAPPRPSDPPGAAAKGVSRAPVAGPWLTPREGTLIVGSVSARPTLPPVQSSRFRWARASWLAGAALVLVSLSIAAMVARARLQTRAQVSEAEAPFATEMPAPAVPKTDAASTPTGTPKAEVASEPPEAPRTAGGGLNVGAAKPVRPATLDGAKAPEAARAAPNAAPAAKPSRTSDPLGAGRF